MEYLLNKFTNFYHFLHTLEAVDTKFQKANRPSGVMEEGKSFYSEKHKLYGYNVEVTVRTSGTASPFSTHYACSVSDLTTFIERIAIHRCRIRKGTDDESYDNNGICIISMKSSGQLLQTKVIRVLLKSLGW